VHICTHAAGSSLLALVPSPLYAAIPLAADHTGLRVTAASSLLRQGPIARRPCPHPTATVRLDRARLCRYAAGTNHGQTSSCPHDTNFLHRESWSACAFANMMPWHGLTLARPSFHLETLVFWNFHHSGASLRFNRVPWRRHDSGTRSATPLLGLRRRSRGLALPESRRRGTSVGFHSSQTLST
jgi:hypothetical protein